MSLDGHVSTHRSRDGPTRQAVGPQRSAPTSRWWLPLEDRQELHVDAGRKVPSRRSSLSSTLSPDSSSTNNEPPSNVHPPSHATRPKHLPPSKSEHVASPPEHPPLLEGELVLPRRVICHSAQAQRRMERCKISWAVQYELARGVLSKMWTWDDVTAEVLERLRGSNLEAAPRVPKVMSEAMGEGISARRTDGRVTNLDTW